MNFFNKNTINLQCSLVFAMYEKSLSLLYILDLIQHHLILHSFSRNPKNFDLLD